jgi:hypothetical protein
LRCAVIERENPALQVVLKGSGEGLFQLTPPSVLGGLPVSLVATLLVLPALYVTVHARRWSQVDSETAADREHLFMVKEEVVR